MRGSDDAIYGSFDDVRIDGGSHSVVMVAIVMRWRW